MTSPRQNNPVSELLARCGRAPARRAGGFTLIEALVAVGAMALVTVGIAAIFSSVGKTVATGRRISALNAYAAMIEQRMRKDFSEMTREGFLVVRHSYADAKNDGVNGGKYDPATDVVALTPQDARPRARRTDEIMFFANGDFTSVREPLHPAYTASGKSARIYYGHGSRLPKGAFFAANPTPYDQPELDDPNAITGGVGLGVAGGPNQYASSWTLLRHVTVLAKPESATPKLPPDTVFNWNPARARDAFLLSDKEGQIALQPAASSIFRSMAYVFPEIPFGTFRKGYYVRQLQDNGRRPLLASGIIDVANSDLTDIRSIVMGMPIPAFPTPSSPTTFFGVAADYPPTSAAFPGWDFVPGLPALENARSWMENAWPTSSDPVVNGVFPPGSLRSTRIRYEPSPTAYVDAITNTTKRPVEQTYRRADQLALTAFNFVPGCSEFIVEWSFGDVDPETDPTRPNYGELIWHGLERRADRDNNGLLDKTVARPYPMNAADTPVIGRSCPVNQVYTDYQGWRHDSPSKPAERKVGRTFDDATWVLDPLPNPTKVGTLFQRGMFDRVSVGQVIRIPPQTTSVAQWYKVMFVDPSGAGDYVKLELGSRPDLDPATAIRGEVLVPQSYTIPDSLIYTTAPSATDLAQTAYFGFLDPTDTNTDSNPTIVTLDADAGTGRPWYWPTLIRVTMRLTDQNNPLSEETFQFVFSTPGNPQ